MHKDYAQPQKPTKSQVPSSTYTNATSRLFVLFLGRTLDLCGAPECLLSVLALLACNNH